MRYYGILWRFKGSDRWKFYLSNQKEEGASYSPLLFQWHSDSSHMLPNAKDYMNKYVKTNKVECKIVCVEIKAYDSEVVGGFEELTKEIKL